MNEKIEMIRSKLNDDLDESKSIGNPLERLTESSKAIDRAVRDINQYLKEEKFADDAEEIKFFKDVKPAILALKIEEVFRYSLEVHKPIGTIKIQLKYFEDELKALQSFFRLNSYNFQYYKNDLTELDTLYFLRTSGPLSVPLAEIVDVDTDFATPMTYLFAKFIAYEQLQYDILEQIATLRYPEAAGDQRKNEQSIEMKWTGEVVNIVELAYGIYLTGQLNNGNASLNQIVRWLEGNLHITIGVIQRRFNEIESRKRLRPTRFIEQMMNAVLKKIEIGNSQR